MKSRQEKSVVSLKKVLLEKKQIKTNLFGNILTDEDGKRPTWTLEHLLRTDNESVIVSFFKNDQQADYYSSIMFLIVNIDDLETLISKANAIYDQMLSGPATNRPTSRGYGLYRIMIEILEKGEC